MRTMIWFLYFWFYLLKMTPKSFRMKKMLGEGKEKEVQAEVELTVKDWATKLLNLAGAEIVVEGTENIPTEPALFVSNHQGNFDIPIVLSKLGALKSIVAKIELQKLPGIRTWMDLFHCIFMDRENPRQSLQCLNTAQQYLENGTSVIIFPEGTRSKGNEMGEFKAGALRCAVKAQASIVPIAIDGSYQLMEAHTLWIHPAKVKVTILPPVATRDLDREQAKHISKDIQQKIAECLEGNEQWKNSKNC